MDLELLNSIRTSLHENRERLHIRGQLHLTKSAPAFCDALLLRDLSLEKNVSAWVESKTSFRKIFSRYNQFTADKISNDVPEHYAMRVLSGKGAICSGRNIFLFFPHCLGLTTNNEEDCFGLELIDVWRNVFEKAVFPCARVVLENNNLLTPLPQLLHSLEETTYLASIFHEIGHRVGPWKVSPQAHTNLKVSPFYLDVMGELSTDCLLVQNLCEFSEINTFVTLQRIFWFGRRGYLDNPRSAWINHDNDSWISACLWNEFLKHGILSKTESKWTLQFEATPKFYRKLYTEIENLGHTVLALKTREEQDAAVLSWMKSKVEWKATEGFILPSSLQDAFAECSRLPEIPQFNPILDLNHEELV